MAHTLLNPTHPHVIEFVLPDTPGGVYAVTGPGRRFILTLEPPEVLPRHGSADIMELLLQAEGALWRYVVVFPHTYWRPYREAFGDAALPTIYRNAVHAMVETHSIDIVYLGPSRGTPTDIKACGPNRTEFPIFEQYYYHCDFAEWTLGSTVCPTTGETVHYPLRISQAA